MRRAMTIVEVLVVIAIIGLVAALLLPAVQAAREASRRAQCTSNLRQLGLALHAFHDTQGALPPASWTEVSPGNPLGKFIGWRALVLPHLEQASVQARYDRGLHWWEGNNLETGAISLGVFLCPSVPQRAEVRAAIAKPPRPAIAFPRPLAPSDYEAIMGVQPSVDPARYGRADANRSAMFRNSAIRLGGILDGTSQTLLVVECSARPLVYRRRLVQAGEFNDQGQGWIDSEGPFSLDGSTADGTAQGLGHVRTPVAVNATNLNEPYSFHPGGASGLFADGHVAYAQASVALLTYAALCTRQGSEVLEESFP
jgi:prepilin-type N-terminal cleavage/methylation domain-containing protein/prepilin-type processing-associated H-X9-DG protein